MKRMGNVQGWVIGSVAVLSALAGGCEFVLKTDPNPKVIGEGGSGGETSSTTSSSNGSAHVCNAGDWKACYSGPAGTKGTAACKGGTQTCKDDGSGFGVCVGEVTPQAETCGDTSDENCDGLDCVQWAESFGDKDTQVANAVAVDANGNSYVCGNLSGTITLPTGTLSAPTMAYPVGFLVKLDLTGKPLWGKAFGVAATCSAVAVDAQDHVVVGGASAGSIDFGAGPTPAGMYVAQFNGAGEVQWSRSYTPSTGNFDGTVFALAFAANGDVIAGGGFGADGIDFGDGLIPGPAGSNWFGFVARLRGWDGSAKKGTGGWGKVLCGGTTDCRADSVAVDATGNIVVAGDFSGTLTLTTPQVAAGARDAFVGRLAADGLPLLSTYLGASGATLDNVALAIDSAGAMTLAGNFEGTVDFGEGNVTAPEDGAGFLVHYGADQSYKWSHALPHGAVSAVAADAQGNLFLSGKYASGFDIGGSIMGGDVSGAYLAKLSGTGVYAWARGYKAATLSYVPGVAKSITVTAAGDPILVGSFTDTADFGAGLLTSAGDQDVLVAKLSR